MKNALSILVAIIALVAGDRGSVPEALAEPVVQVVQVSGYRARFDTGDPVFVRYLLIDPGNADPAVDGFAAITPRAVLMLFPGGDGRLNLALNQINTGSTNFVVRTRYHFAAEGFVVAVIDAASDFLAHNHSDETGPDGLVHGSGLRGHRLPSRLHGDKYLQDLGAVMNDLRVRYPNLPLWAVGTSRGTISAAVAAADAVPRPDGIVLTSSLTGPSDVGDLTSVNLESITVPALIVTHRSDGCAVTKPDDSRGLKRRFVSSPRVRVLVFHGGSTPLSDPCDPLSGHGYFGVEQTVIDDIAKWIRGARPQGPTPFKR